MERELLQPHSQDPAALHVVDAVLERATSRRATSGFDVREVARALRSEQLRRRSSTQAWIIGVAAILISFLALILICLKAYKLPCSHIRISIRSFKRIHPTECTQPNTLGLKDDALELQTQPDRNGDEPTGVTRREETRDFRREQPASFVRHGALKAGV